MSRILTFWRGLPPTKWLVLLLLGFILWTLIGPILNTVLPRTSKPNFRQEMNHMRQIGMALFEFEIEFGKMPDDTTAKLVQERNLENRVPMGGSSSNDYFHQLIAAGIVHDPMIFYGSAVASERPLRDWEPDMPLPPGTCGFAYIIRDAENTPPFTPLVVYPLKHDEMVFLNRVDSKRNNHAVVLYADSSVRQHLIDRKGRMMIDGLDFFDPNHPHWNGRSFRLAWPE